MVQSATWLRFSDPRRGNAGHFRAHGDAAPFRHHRIAAGTVRPGALRARSEGAHGGGSTARRRAARPVVTLTLVFNPGLARLPCRFDGGPRPAPRARPKRTGY